MWGGKNVIMGRLNVLSRQASKNYKRTVLDHPGTLAVVKHDITIWHCGQHHSPCTCVGVCVCVHLCVILVFIHLILTHHFIVFFGFLSPLPFHALLFTPISVLGICFVSLCFSTTLPIGPTRSLSWFTLLSCLCVWCVLGLFINSADEGSRSSELLVNYQTMWHHIPEDYKLHSQRWTCLWTGWSLLSSQMNQHNLQLQVNKNFSEWWGVPPLQNQQWEELSVLTCCMVWLVPQLKGQSQSQINQRDHTSKTNKVLPCLNSSCLDWVWEVQWNGHRDHQVSHVDFSPGIVNNIVCVPPWRCTMSSRSVS